jgi:HD-GYP domain-containing protein (c-di-GMP phosphodiesterase class II)
MGADKVVETGHEPRRVIAEFFPVPIDALQTTALELDLYLVHGSGRPVLYRSPGSAYTPSDCLQLAGQGVTHLYVPLAQHRVFQAVVSRRLVEAYEDPALERAERTRIVRGACGKMIEDFMAEPGTPGLAGTIGAMADRFSAWCTADGDQFGHLLDMSAHDYYTITHMVNVGVGCGLLGAELLGPDDPMVRDLVLGGLVHDVGKRGVPAEVLNKEGKLTDEEWEVLREHPTVGAAILSAQEHPEPLAVEMALSHHERLDGKGYPNRLVESKIGLPARICAVVDIYDAMTSSRPYRGPIPPRTVLAKMREEVGTAVDGAVFAAWERVVERMITAEPGRAVPDDPHAVAPSLAAILPSPGGVSAIADREPACKKHLTVRRADGTSVGAEVVVWGVGEWVLRLDGRFRAGERVGLVHAEGKAWLGVFQSTRVASDGGQLVVFRLEKAARAAG